ncbi:hypothetical protein PHYNN_198 [Pantoea phage Phynn]|nr:hypothetical protein PHYNN_198 [Pantoea phage Phynn]
MSIKRISQALMLGLLLSSSATQAHDGSIPKEFDSYINAALKVYLDVIPPSVNTSELFYTYMERSWHDRKCKEESECRRLGVRVAHEFASNYRS